MQRYRISRPPITPFRELDRWLETVTDAINALPNFSISSTTNGPESVITADSGTLLIDIGSSATTYWLKESGSTSIGWSTLSLI